MVRPFIFQIVGFQNSGKTTLINKIIQRLNSENLRIATIKHHGHGGKPEINEKKDSSSYIQSGAKASIVEGDGRLLLEAEKSVWPLIDQIRLLISFHLNIILIEGHKYEKYPKTLILNNPKDIFLIKELTNIKVVFYRDLKEIEVLKHTLTIPTFHIDDDKGFEWIINYLKSQLL